MYLLQLVAYPHTRVEIAISSPVELQLASLCVIVHVYNNMLCENRIKYNI